MPDLPEIHCISIVRGPDKGPARGRRPNSVLAARDRKLLGAPDGFQLVSLIALGYPGEQPVREKRALEDVVHWEKY